jgi:hypothetical protein
MGIAPSSGKSGRTLAQALSIVPSGNDTGRDTQSSKPAIILKKQMPPPLTIPLVVCTLHAYNRKSADWALFARKLQVHCKPKGAVCRIIGILRYWRRKIHRRNGLPDSQTGIYRPAESPDRRK